MDAQETRDNNKVLAEFMSDMEGWEFLYENEGYKFYRNPWQKSYPAYDENLEVVGARYAGDCNFKFHESWDWLMPVCRKIRDLLDSMERPSQNHGCQGDIIEVDIHCALREIDIQKTFKHVIQFVEWWNGPVTK